MTNYKSSFNLASALGVAIVFLAGCEYREPHSAASESLAMPESRALETASRLKSHMEFLADDRLSGRYPGDIGYDVAALYVETRLRSFGVGYVPGYDSYLDPVSLVRSERDFTEQKLRIGSCDVSPDNPDLVFGASVSADGQEDVDAAAVFVGYGIEAPEYNVDDYAGVDVDGKVAVFLNGFPSSLPGDVGAHYLLMKTEFAAANGAVATLELETHASLRRRTWELIRETFNGPTVNLEGVLPQESPLAFRSSIRTHGAISECLFTDAPKSLEELLAEADVDGALPSGFALNTSVSYRRQNSSTQILESQCAWHDTCDNCETRRCANSTHCAFGSYWNCRERLGRSHLQRCAGQCRRCCSVVGDCTGVDARQCRIASSRNIRVRIR